MQREDLPLLASHLQVWLPALAEESWDLSFCAYDSLPQTARSSLFLCGRTPTDSGNTESATRGGRDAL